MNTLPKVQLRGVYKIFGGKPAAMLKHVLAGVGKDALLKDYGHVLGLSDINVDMQAGEITVVMGLSGSGKSTLIRHLNRLIEPTGGEIMIDGTDVMKLSPDELRDLRRHKMSMVFQKFALLPHRTVQQNAAMSLEIDGTDATAQAKEAQVWLERVGLKGYENHYPFQLSGGMQQRVGIARALASNSEIMLMDEAFSALDPLIRTDMQDLLLELQLELKKTIIFITHDLDEALKLADHLVILKNGRVIQQGDPQDILLNPADPYIEDFISDINRARVVRVRSIMVADTGQAVDGEVEPEATVEQLIALSNGDTTKSYRIVENGIVIGVVTMLQVIKALVPRSSKQETLAAE